MIYRPTNVNLVYTIKLFECLNWLCNVQCLCYLCGDFNLPNVNWFNMSDGVPAAENCLANFISQNGFSQLMLSPIHGDNIINLIIASGKHSLFNVDLQPPFSTSDHAAITWQTQPPSVTPESNKATHNFARADYDSLEQYFNGINWLDLFLPVPPNDVNGLWYILQKTVCDAIDLYVPKSLSDKTKHHTYLHFIQIAFNKKRALWRKRNSRLGLAAYKLQAIKCNRILKQHFSHIEQRLLNNGSNKAFYKYVNKKLCASKFLATLKDSAGNIITDDLHKANEFNAYFTSIF